VFLAVETLSLSGQDKYKRQLDAWFETVADENNFVPTQYAVLARQILDVP